MRNFSFNKVAILGVGLIGASCARALKEKGLCSTIVGYGRREEHLQQAKERAIIDDYSLDSREACNDADLVILATPVGLFTGLIEQIHGSLKKGALVTDVGSVKGTLVQEIEVLMPEGVHYVGAHPIAGGDKSGIEEARADLFSGALCIITPTRRTDLGATERIVMLWKQLGARVELLDPELHDEIYGAVSHLPHIVAYALVNTIGEINAEYLTYAGQGFKDATRIALSSPEMWRDIAILNRENLVRQIDTVRDHLERMRNFIDTMDASCLEQEFNRAQELRKKLK